MSPVYRRNPRRSRFGTGNATVTIGIPLSPITAGGLWILIARWLLLLGG